MNEKISHVIEVYEADIHSYFHSHVFEVRRLEPNF